LVAELLCVKSQTLSSMVKDRIQKYPSSGEINFTVKDAKSVFERIQHYDWGESYELHTIDGLDLVFKDWRMNVRSSNTEPLVRLNIESKGNPELVVSKLKLLEGLIC
jgi:phosphomannomutase